MAKKFRPAIVSTIDALFAGAMIAIGAIAYLNCPNKLIGSLLFSIGLIVIMSFDFKLYTGSIGYVRCIKHIPFIVNTIVMNCVGCCLITLVPTEGAYALMQAKLDESLAQVFVKALICGVLIFVCVAHKQDIRITMLAVPAFILSGAEHSIADVAFALAAKSFSWECAIFLLIVVLGNAVGALTISLWIEQKTKWEKEEAKRISMRNKFRNR